MATGNQIAFPNGIIRRTVNGQEEFLIAETLRDRILIYKREEGSIKLNYDSKITAFNGLDNFSVGDDGAIYVGGHSEAWKFLAKSYFPKHSPPSSSHVIRIPADTYE